MFFKKIWLKLTNSNEFKTQKFLQVRENAKIEYKEKFAKKIELIHQKIESQKKLNFLRIIFKIFIIPFFILFVYNNIFLFWFFIFI